MKPSEIKEKYKELLNKIKYLIIEAIDNKLTYNYYKLFQKTPIDINLNETFKIILPNLNDEQIKNYIFYLINDIITKYEQENWTVKSNHIDKYNTILNFYSIV